MRLIDTNVWEFSRKILADGDLWWYITFCILKFKITNSNCLLFTVVFEQSKRDGSTAALSCQDTEGPCDPTLNKVTDRTIETTWSMVTHVALYHWLVLWKRRAVVINRDMAPSNHAVPHSLSRSQAQQTSVTHCEHSAHSSYCHPQGEAGFPCSVLYHCRLSCCYVAPNSRRSLPFVLNCSAVPTLRCSNGPPWRPTKLRRHVARLPNNHWVTTRTSARSLQQKAGLLQSTPTTLRRVKLHSLRSEGG